MTKEYALSLVRSTAKALHVTLTPEEEEEQVQGLLANASTIEAGLSDEKEEEITSEDAFPLTDATPQERKVLFSYRNYSYEEINNYLRFQKTSSAEVGIITNWIKILDAVISKNKSLSDGIVYRIVEKGNWLADEFVERAFLSTSFSKEYLVSQEGNYEDPVILEIFVPKGTSYARVAEHPEDDFEGEVLLPRGGILKKKSDLTYLFFE